MYRGYRYPLGLIWGYIGIMEKWKMPCRVGGFGFMRVRV